MSPVPPKRTTTVRASTSLLVLVLAIAACTTKEQKPADTSAAAIRPDSASRQLATTPGAAAASLPGALARSIDSLSGAELRDFVRGLRWGGGQERQRRCQGDPACSGTKPGKTTLVRVDAVDGQDSLTTAGLPANGVIAAKLENKGSLEEQRFHLKPGARYEYYVIVYGGDSTGTWRLEELESVGSAYSHRTVERGVFRPCNHPFERGARADFKSCAAAAAAHTQGLMLQGSGDSSLTDPIWVSCAFGCCIMDQGV